MIRLVSAPRFAVYLSCTLAAVLANFVLGKDMMWDTVNYHLYAGFSALHDRLGVDYFPAGPQSYFNPYIYVPFYLLATSALPAIAAASLLAIVQSAILWLTYELALEIVPSDEPRTRIAAAACAAALAFINPILIGELGSSYADITTAELALAGWLLLIRNGRTPSAVRTIGAGLLLGAVTALKLTNAAHALAASVLLLLYPMSLRARLHYLAGFVLALGIGFTAVAAPWAMRLEHVFGNPFFPLLNDVFRSPQYSTGTMLDYRFIPGSIAEALWRPFALVAPSQMVDNELSSPDMRYALLLIVGSAALSLRFWRGFRRTSAAILPGDPATRRLAVLGCAFLVDWIIWLRESGNGRYFLPMACVAGVLATALLFRLLAAHPRVRNYLLLAIFCAQAIQLAFGSEYRYSAPWDGGRWFEVSLPKELRARPGLYFTYGDPPNAFMAPFLPAGSGLVNIGGAYALRPDGANGDAVRRLIHKFSPHLQVILLHPYDGKKLFIPPHYFARINDALGAFDLRLERGRCAKIAVRDAAGSAMVPVMELPRSADQAAQSTGYLLSCPVVPAPARRASLLAAERAANVVFDRLEAACPGLFQPSRPVTQDYSSGGVEIWVRRYVSTHISAAIGPSGVVVRSDEGFGGPDYLGAESDWERTSLRLTCGRRHGSYYARLLSGSP